jgi:DNA-binding response OmpR family regulator
MQAKILLIDDDTALLKLLGQYLEQAGYKVSRAADGRQGLQTLYKERPDLVILDVMLPHLDGWTVCERIRDLSDVPIIMLTAKGEEMDKLRGFRLGVGQRCSCLPLWRIDH